MGLKENLGLGKQEGGEIAYVLVKYASEAIMRAKRCSNDSPMNSGSSLTSTLYFHIIIVITATLSVSKNLKKKLRISTSPRGQMIESARTVSRCTPVHLQRIHNARPGILTGSILTCAKRQERVPRPISKESLRSKCVGVLPILRWETSVRTSGWDGGGSTYDYSVGRAHEFVLLSPKG